MSNKLLDSMSQNELKSLHGQLTQKLEGHGAGIGEGVDWGSIADTDFELQKHKMFAATKAAARRKSVAAEHKKFEDS